MYLDKLHDIQYKDSGTMFEFKKLIYDNQRVVK